MEKLDSAEIVRFEARPENACFGCGGGNPRGMKLEFDGHPAQRRVTGRFKFGPEFQGSMGILHGGIIALLFDEAMGKLNRFSEVRAVTAELNVEYLRPIHVDQEIEVEAFETEREGRNLCHHAEIRSLDGKVLARGKGRFVVIDPERIARRGGQRQ